MIEDPGIWIAVTGVYVLTPLLALVASGFARSAKARWVLIAGALCFLAIFGLTTLFHALCTGTLLKGLNACMPAIALPIGTMLSPILLVGTILAYPILGPLLLIAAAVLEWRARR